MKTARHGRRYAQISMLAMTAGKRFSFRIACETEKIPVRLTV